MESKKSHPENGGDMTEQSEERQKKTEFENDNNASQQTLEETRPQPGKKGPDAGHGNRFQSKLLTLYALRAINFGYQFYLGTELSVGDKFDDLIFHYKEENETTFRQQYLQAKHILNENDSKKQITAANLLDVNKGNFSLLKYFQSYVKIISEGNDIEHCIICTNVDFNHNDLNGISLDPGNCSILLDCKDEKKEQTCYKLKVPDNLKKTLIGSIQKCIDSYTGKKMELVFKNCIEEVNGKQFKDHTADEMELFFSDPQNQNQIEKLFVEVFDEFLEKLVFAVKTPNESELDSILAKEVGKYFKLTNAALPSAYITNEMINWFKKQDDKHCWLTAKETGDILKEKTGELIALIEITCVSNDYQVRTLKKDELKFNDSETLKKMTKVIDSFCKDFQENIKYITSETPKLTAVKVISTIQNMPEFPNKDDYLVISSKRLREDIKKFIKWLNVEKCHQLLIVVDGDANNPLKDVQLYENLIPENSKKKIIFISKNNLSDLSIKDKITYEDLSETTKELIGKRQVSFQGTDLSVNSLIETNKTNEVLDSQSIENLLQMAESTISPFSSDLFKSLYIERKLKSLSKDELLEKLAKDLGGKINEEIRIDSIGKIEWKTQNDKRKKEIWEHFKILLKRQDVPSTDEVHEGKLINSTNKIIIKGVAGTGKSTILSHYYELIKKQSPDHLVFKVNLNSYSKTFKEANNINDFLLNNVIDQNPFARSLLKHRLETGDRLVLMLDGFDEIDGECQDKIIQLVKKLNESIPLYITTRPHLADKLQDELSQWAYSLVKFTQEDQINYVISIWKDFLVKGNVFYKEDLLQSFATKLIDRVSQTLNDKEKEFIGIPLQCRILAECFQAKIKDEIIENSTADLFHLIGEDQQFDFASLYKSMIEEKRRVFRQEKIKFNSGDNHIVDDSIEKKLKKIERHLTKLAIQTIVAEKDVDILIPSSVGFQSKSNKKMKEKQLNEDGIRFGLLNKGNHENEIQFLHRTYAEYFVADFIFQGFVLDEEKHNHLLENESTRKWIIGMLTNFTSYGGVLIFLNSMFKEIISNEQWKNRIELQPVRFQQFTNSLFNDYEPSLLNINIAEEEGNILSFILDCLDKAFYGNPSKILAVIETSIRYCMSSILDQRVDVFARILHYFDNADDERKTEIINILCSNFPAGLGLGVRFESQNVKRFFQFMLNNLDQVKPMRSAGDYKLMFAFFIYSEHEELRKQMLEIVTSIFTHDSDLTSFMRWAIKVYGTGENWTMGQIEKTLVSLKDKGRNEVAVELSRFVLITISQEIKQENANICLWLEELGMIGLHGAALKGDLEFIENEIGCSLDDPNPDKYPEEIRNSVLRHIVFNRHDSDTGYESYYWITDYSPLHVVAAYGHEEICRKIFIFLPDPGKVNDDKGFLSRTLKDAVRCRIVLMFKTILKSVKAIWGQSALVELLKSVVGGQYWGEDGWKMIIKTMTEIAMQDELICYQDLNDLVLHNLKTLRMLEHVESDVLQGMIAAGGGLENWIKRLIDTDVKEALEELYSVLSSDGFLHKLDKENQISHLIDILTTKRQKKRGVIDCYWFDFVKGNNNRKVRDFLAAISKTNVCEDELKRLVLFRDDNNILILLKYPLREGRDEYNKILNVLPENVKAEFEDLSKKQITQLIDHYFTSPKFLKSLNETQKLTAIELYLENGNQKHLSKFKKVVQLDQLETVFERLSNRWSDERRARFISLLKEKLDSQTLFKYNDLIEKYASSASSINQKRKF